MHVRKQMYSYAQDSDGGYVLLTSGSLHRMYRLMLNLARLDIHDLDRRRWFND